MSKRQRATICSQAAMPITGKNQGGPDAAKGRQLIAVVLRAGFHRSADHRELDAAVGQFHVDGFVAAANFQNHLREVSRRLCRLGTGVETGEGPGTAAEKSQPDKNRRGSCELGKIAFDHVSTGAKISPLPEDREDITVNNRLRRELGTALAALKLVSPDRKVRLTAATELSGGAEAAMLPLVKLVILALAWAYFQHFCAGIRHLFMDLHMGLDKDSARKSSAAVLAVSLFLTFVTALKLFGVF